MGTPGLPTDKERADEIKGLATPPPNSSGGFDVKPSHLYSTSYRVRDEQFTYNGAAKTLMDALSGHEQLAGNGTGPDKLAASYKNIATLFFQVWADSVVSVGGAAVGFTMTANNYAAADWFTNRKQFGPPPRTQPPMVIRTPPHYGDVPDLAWRGTNADSPHVVIRALGHIPDFLADHVQGAIDKALQLGKLYEITPGADKDELKNIAAAWGTVSTAGGKSADALNDAIAYITDGPVDSEWQQAMRAFCQTIWGTTAWGKSRGVPAQPWKTATSASVAGRRPIVTVLGDTAKAVQQALLNLIDAANKVTGVSEPAAEHAAKEMIKDMVKKAGHNPLRGLFDLTPIGAVDLTAQMVLSFRSHMDYAGINAAVDAYNDTCAGIATTLDGLEESLREAEKSAPTFNAEEARAEGFGSRALNEFKHEHKWTVQGDPASAHKYPLDLANQEFMSGAHGVDKHVGKTDTQLVQRLRDQSSGIPAASSFTSMQDAQKYTQMTIDQNNKKISDYLASGPPYSQSSLVLKSDFPADGPVTGRGLTRDDYNTSTDDAERLAKVKDAHQVQVRIKPDPNVDPPFVVITSTPD